MINDTDDSDETDNNYDSEDNGDTVDTVDNDNGDDYNYKNDGNANIRDTEKAHDTGDMLRTMTMQMLLK